MRTWLTRAVLLAAFCTVAGGALIIGYGLSKGYDVTNAMWQLVQPAPAPVAGNPLQAQWPTQRVSWLGDIENRDLNESSGLTASILHPGVLWSINDSGGNAEIFAMRTTGEHVGRWRIDAPAPTDWESMDSFELNGRAYIAIADVGDNLQWRDDLSVIMIEEPISLAPTDAPIPVNWRVAFHYPGQPEDCEAMAIDAEEQTIYLLSKRSYPPRLYKVPLRTPEFVQATFVQTLPGFPRPTEQDKAETEYWRWRHAPTGMDLHGSKLLVTTYRHAYLFDRNALDAGPQRVRLPSNGAREAITFAYDTDRTAFTSRERDDGDGVADILQIDLARRDSVEQQQVLEVLSISAGQQNTAK